MLKVLLLSGALALTAASAHAGVIFTDNFNSDTPGLNSPGDAYFTSTSPPLTGPNGGTFNRPGLASIDIIGAGTGFDFLPGNGLYVDLDGSSGTGNLPDAGQLTYTGTNSTSTTPGTFAPGKYVLTFDLAGNQRGAPVQELSVDAGNASTSFAPLSTQGFEKETLDFTVTSQFNGLQFTEFGPSSQQGNLLDNVSVSAVPEPATWAMMLIGFFGMAFAIRSNRRSTLRLA